MNQAWGDYGFMGHPEILTLLLLKATLLQAPYFALSVRSFLLVVSIANSADGVCTIPARDYAGRSFGS